MKGITANPIDYGIPGFFSLESWAGRRVPLATWTWDCGRWAWLGYIGHAIGWMSQSIDAGVPTLAVHPRDLQRGFWPKILRLTRELVDAGYEPSTAAALLEAKGLNAWYGPARILFDVHLNVQRGEVVALMGLSLCHHWLGDKPNCTRTLEEILKIDPVTTLKLAIAGLRDLYGAKEFRMYNPFAISKWIKQYKQPTQEDVMGFFGKSPLIKYGKLIFSDRARKEFKRELILDAVNMSEEATAIRRIQESVSLYLRKPIPWLQALK